MLNIKAAMLEIEGVGVTIQPFHTTMKEQCNGECRPMDLEERSFYGLAKLWKVVQRIISLCFIKKLCDGSLKLCDEDGNLYGVVVTERMTSRPATLWPVAEGAQDDSDRQ
jgi:hypothetical protein